MSICACQTRLALRAATSPIVWLSAGGACVLSSCFIYAPAGPRNLKSVSFANHDISCFGLRDQTNPYSNNRLVNARGIFSPHSYAFYIPRAIWKSLMSYSLAYRRMSMPLILASSMPSSSCNTVSSRIALIASLSCK